MNLGENSTFITYHPVNSFLYFLIIILASMFTLHPIFLLLSALGAFLYGWVLEGWQDTWRYMKYTILLMLIVILGNTLLSHNGVTVFFYVNNNAITLEAMCYGGAMGLMIANVIHWFSIAQIICTQDKFLYLFGKWSPSIALMLSMMFRYIPILKKRYQMIHQAQYAMGRTGRGGAVQQFMQAAKEAGVLISWSLENSIETADSMEARGYGLPGRTSFHLFRFSQRDVWNILFQFLVGGILVAAIMMGHATAYYYPKMIFPIANKETIVSIAAFICMLLMPVQIDVRGEQKWKRLQ